MQFTPGHGWQEVVTSVRNLNRWIEDLDTLAGWSLVSRGPTDDRLLKAWHLTDKAQAEEAVVICRDDPARWMRLMSFSGVPQKQIRSSGKPWETGGLFSILIYAADTEAAVARAQKIGWSAYNEPVVMEFGGRELLNVVLRGPDGCNFGLYQPLTPKPDKPFPFSKLGPPFNGQQMVRNTATTERFYAETLGWQSWFTDAIKLTCNNFGIPDNLVAIHPKHIALMHPGDQRYGQAELVQWTWFEGRDFTDQAIPPNLGHLALRWPVNDLDSYMSRFKKTGVPLMVEPTVVTLPPLGDVRLCTVRTPDGTMFELIQPISGESN